jgi:hypothetical protein
LEWDRRLGDYAISSWTSISFVYENQPDQAARLLDVVAQPAATSIDSTTSGPTISGRISNESALAGIAVEVDLDGDGVVDRSSLTDANGLYQLRLSGLDEG